MLAPPRVSGALDRKRQKKWEIVLGREKEAVKKSELLQSHWEDQNTVAAELSGESALTALFECKILDLKTSSEML